MNSSSSDSCDNISGNISGNSSSMNTTTGFSPVTFAFGSVSNSNNMFEQFPNLVNSSNPSGAPQLFANFSNSSNQSGAPQTTLSMDVFNHYPWRSNGSTNLVESRGRPQAPLFAPSSYRFNGNTDASQLFGQPLFAIPAPDNLNASNVNPQRPTESNIFSATYNSFSFNPNLSEISNDSCKVAAPMFQIAFKHGIPTSLFAEEPDDAFVCVICLEVFNDPVGCKNGHGFCKPCITKSLVQKSECPQCRTALTENTLSSNLLIKGLINKLSVRCKTILESSDSKSKSIDDDLCGWVGPFSKLSQHLEKDCGYVPTRCNNSDCDVVVRMKDMPDHASVCSSRPVACQYCNVDIALNKLDAHTFYCDHKPIKCSNAGCQVEDRVKNINKHAEICDFRLVQCPLVEMGLALDKCDCNGMIRYCDLDTHVSDPKKLFLALHQTNKRVKELESIVNKLQNPPGLQRGPLAPPSFFRK